MIRSLPSHAETELTGQMTDQRRRFKAWVDGIAHQHALNASAPRSYEDSQAGQFSSAPPVVKTLMNWGQLAPWLPRSVFVPLAREGIDPNSDLGLQVIKHSPILQPTPRPYSGSPAGQLTLAGPAVEQRRLAQVAPPGSLRDQQVKMGLPIPTNEEFTGAIGSALGAADKVTTEGLKTASQVATGAMDVGGELLGTLGARIAGPFTHPVETYQGVTGGAQAATRPGLERLSSTPSPGGYQPPTDSPFELGQIPLNQWLFHHKKPGDGYFISGDAQKAAIEQQKKSRGAIDGHAATFGRLVAADVVEPGSKPYNILSGMVDGIINWKLDPTAIALTKIGDVRESQKIFDTYGVFTNGVTKHFHGPTADAWMHGNAAQRFYRKAAQETSISTLNAHTKGQWPAAVLADVIDAKTPEAVQAAISDHLGASIRDVPKWGYTIAPSLSTIRLANNMPNSQRISSKAIDQAFEQMRRLMVAEKLPKDQIDNVLYKVARAENDPVKFYDAVVNTGGKAMADHLVNLQHFGDKQVREGKLAIQRARKDLVKANKGFGVTPTEPELRPLAQFPDMTPEDVLKLRQREARRVTTFFQGRTAQDQKFWVDELGRAPHLPGVQIDGEPVPIVGPHLPSELLNDVIPLPDARKLREATMTWRRWVESGVLNDKPIVGQLDRGLGKAGHFSFLALEGLTNAIFKPWALIRGALPVRVIGEAQVASATAGYDSLFRHPIHWVGAVVGKKGNVDYAGIPFNQAEGDILSEVMSTPRMWRNYGPRSGGVLDKFYAKHWEDIPNTDARFPKSLADEISHLHIDEVTRRTARDVVKGDQGLTATKDWFWKSPLRQQMVDSGDWATNLVDRQFADAYIDSAWQRIKQTTAGNTDLINEIANGENLRYGNRLNPNFVKRVQAHTLVGKVPDSVKGRITVGAGGERGSELAAKYDHAIDTLFGGLMDVPTKVLVKHPLVRQMYWQRMSEMFGKIEPQAQESLLREAEASGVRKDLLKRMGKVSNFGDLKVEDADHIAKAWALHNSKKFMHDITEKSNFMDMARIVFPFGEAFKQVVTRWAKLARDQPQVLRRTQQIIEGGRGARVPGTPANQGFFHQDDTGRWVFTYPFSDAVDRAWSGAPFPFQGDLQALNIAGNGYPGFGPSVQLGVDWALPDNATFDNVRRLVMPFGGPDVGQGAIEAFFPGWAQRIRTAGGIELPSTHTKIAIPFLQPTEQQMRLHSNTIKQTMAYLYSTGRYDNTDRESMQKLMIDSKHMADKLYTLRSLAQNVLPAAPQVIPKLHTKNAGLAELYLVTNDFHKMEKADFDNAVPNFIQKYGANDFLAMQSFTRQEVYNPPVTKQAKFWEADHANFVSKYRDVAGFFGPTGATRDYQAYLRAIDNGLTDTLSTDEFWQAANHRVASSIYAQARQGVGSTVTETERDDLRTLQDVLKKQYPGYDPEGTIGKRTSPDRAMRDLLAAANDPEVKNMRTARYVRMYFDARSTLLGKLKAAGYNSLDSKAAAPARELLGELGDVLYHRDARFQPIWDYLLGNEVSPKGAP